MSARGLLPASIVRSSLSLASIVVAVLGVTVGFVLTVVAVILWLGLLGIEGLTQVEIATVFASGILALVLGYAGWRGFLRFAG